MPFGLIAAGGSLLGGIGSLVGGVSGSSAASAASGLQQTAYNDIKNNLSPYLKIGTQGFQQVGDLFGINSDTGTVDTTANYWQPISSVVGKPPSPDDQSLVTSFRASPGYQYMVDQGRDAVQNSAAGKTGAISGNALTAIGKQTAGYADTDYWNYYNALLTNYYNRYNDISNNRNQILTGLEWLGGSGQNAATNLGGFSQSSATNQGNYGIYGSNALSSGLTGFGNSLSNYGYGRGYGGGYDYGGYGYDTGTGGYMNGYYYGPQGGDYGGGGGYY